MKKINKKAGIDFLSGTIGRLVIGLLVLLVVGLGYLIISGKLTGIGIFIRNLFGFRGFG